jgi:hypothetical protein
VARNQWQAATFVPIKTVCIQIKEINRKTGNWLPVTGHYCKQAITNTKTKKHLKNLSYRYIMFGKKCLY